MKDIIPESINLILCDLPYNQSGCEWDMPISLSSLWEHYERIITPTGAIVLFSAQPFTTDLINSNRKLFKYSWVWEKSKAGDIFNAKNKPMRKHEDICVFSKANTANGSKLKMNYFPQGLVECNKTMRNTAKNRAFFATRKSHQKTYQQTQTGYPTTILKFKNETGWHQTQKPVSLLEYLVRTYTQEGDTVLDNCMGSGSTALACINSNRLFIGMEKDDKIYEDAILRIKTCQEGKPDIRLHS